MTLVRRITCENCEARLPVADFPNPDAKFLPNNDARFTGYDEDWCTECNQYMSGEID